MANHSKSVYVTRTQDNLGTATDGRAVLAADTDQVHAAVQEGAANAFPGPITQPDVPRVLTATFAAGWQGGDITIVGLDAMGRTVTEVIPDTAGATVTGTTVFAHVVSITKEVVAGTTDTVTVGVGAANYYSTPWGKPHSDGWAAHIRTTGTLTGTWSMWLSNVEKPDLGSDADWVEDTDFPETNPAGAATKYAVSAGNAKFDWYRLKYVNASGTGSLFADVTVPRA